MSTTHTLNECEGHSPTTFPKTEICQYEREFCHKWFILYSSFNLTILETELSVWQAVLSKKYFFYVFYSRVGEIFVFTVSIP